MVSVFMRPNPTIDWRPFNDAVYDPIWQASADTGLPIALHPFLVADLPGACKGLRLSRPLMPNGRYMDDYDPDDALANVELMAHPELRPTNIFTQGIANPFDVMSCIAFLTAGGVCERFPDAKFIMLEANGGWLVPWLERLDHHCRKYQWEVENLTMLPSEYFRRQCWISFDPDEAMLRHDRGVTAGRCRPHHLGERLPASRCEVPRRHRGARGGARRTRLRAEAPDHLGERPRALRDRLTSRVLVAGAGIGGLVTALSLAEIGASVDVYESVREVRPLGVGINLLPHAVRELDALGLLDALRKRSVAPESLVYCSHRGQEIWREARGTAAGYPWPQLSIHRGVLQEVLLDTFVERVGSDYLHLDHRLVRVDAEREARGGHLRSRKRR